MALTELLPTIRQLSAIEKRELIRILMAEEDISDDIFPLEPYKIYYQPTPYDTFGAGAALMRAMNLANSNEN
ncbi:MAG: hypothetical protein EAZ78_01355 [Oscillatoriales cyanobacterium]|nr:MAG: hypothetical protein EA000_12740 [Oscillatoriales cyanobacterium]TAD97799.1 MAG: hypothetical protein EAZ96_24830 [Oscillatoriales cyanobacterium]TAE01686.1 MAG: hypothetical protein EAZ98_02910 [Oscillatoriales cyanobacterium]TAF06948.1 MAG: hypothetical protein EAZ78_01355 [Oscillatoriales cyanobacterium]TAF30569.1 MAG: hypothetical protein EAZ68_22680 [Oscillatoriales cyanobacterium]